MTHNTPTTAAGARSIRLGGDMSARYVTIPKASEQTGYSEKAIHHKIEQGVWPEGVVARRAPDKRWLIDMEAYEKWAEGQLNRYVA